jgi:hypothetical protein
LKSERNADDQRDYCERNIYNTSWWHIKLKLKELNGAEQLFGGLSSSVYAIRVRHVAKDETAQTANRFQTQLMIGLDDHDG